MSERDRKLLEFEKRLARVDQKLSVEEATSLIADEFIEFGTSGKVWNKAEIVSAIANWPPSRSIVENFCVTELSPSVCLVTYKLRGAPEWFGSTLRSSIWRCTDGKWQMMFHQGTRCNESQV
jgi:hypothetical protein